MALVENASGDRMSDASNIARKKPAPERPDPVGNVSLANHSIIVNLMIEQAVDRCLEINAKYFEECWGGERVERSGNQIARDLRSLKSHPEAG